MSKRFATMLVAFTLFAVAPAALQAQGFQIGGSAGIFIPGGDDFEDLDSGFGFEGSLGYVFAGGFEFNGVFHWNTNDVEAVADESVDIIGILANPRYNFGTGSSVGVFIGARGGWARVSSGDDDATEDEDSNGFLFGPEAGIDFWVSPSVAIGAKGTLDFLTLEEDEVSGERPNGTMLGIQGGVKIRTN